MPGVTRLWGRFVGAGMWQEGEQKKEAKEPAACLGSMFKFYKAFEGPTGLHLRKSPAFGHLITLTPGIIL